MAEPVQLDKAWMENFINVDVRDFQGELERILKDKEAGDDSVLSLRSLQTENPLPEWAEDDIPSGAQLPLVIGKMATDEATNGKNIQETLTRFIDQIVGMIENQQTLFDDIEQNLRDSLETMLKTQAGNLDKIDGEKFLDALDDVEDDLMTGSGEGENDE